MTEKIRAPWTPAQVAALNRFQREGGMHPFTCGAPHVGPGPTLIARVDGWRCPGGRRTACDYRQNWAHAFMADPEAWPKPFQDLREAATGATDGCTSRCEDVTGIRGLLEHVGIDTRGRDITVAGRVVDPATPAPADTLRQRIAEALMSWAEGNNAPQYASIRRPETVTKNAYARADAVLAVVQPEVDRGERLHQAHLEVERRLAVEAQTAQAAVERVQNLGSVWLAAPDPLARAMAGDLLSALRGPNPRQRKALQPPAAAPDAGPPTCEDCLKGAHTLNAHRRQPDTHDDGPSVAEAKADDRAHWDQKYAGEGM